MNFEDLDTANRLVAIRTKCLKALNSVDGKLADKRTQRPDSGGIQGKFDKGFSLHISDNRDGSGDSVNCSGCYVAIEILEATRDVILKQAMRVEEELKALGVDIEVGVQQEVVMSNL